MANDPAQPPPPPPPPAPPAAPPPAHGGHGGQGAPGIAVGGFVCALVGMILAVIGVCFFIGGPLAAIGLVLAIIGRKRAQETGAPQGLATAGVVMGIIGVIAGILWLIVVLASDGSDITYDFDTSAVLPFTLALARFRRVPALRRAGREA